MPLRACWRYEQQGCLTSAHSWQNYAPPLPSHPQSSPGGPGGIKSFLALSFVSYYSFSLFIRQMHEEHLVYARLAKAMGRRSTARWREGQKDRQTNQQVPDKLTDSKAGVLRSTEELNRPGKLPQLSIKNRAKGTRKGSDRDPCDAG